MESLVARYRQAVSSAEKLKQSRAQSQKNIKISPKKQLTMQELESDRQKDKEKETATKQTKQFKELKQKKSISKISKNIKSYQKLNTKSHEKINKKKQTPKKLKPVVTIQSLGDSYAQAIFDLFPKNFHFSQDIKVKIKIFLEEYFNKRLQLASQHDNTNINSSQPTVNVNNMLTQLQQSGFYVIPSQLNNNTVGLFSQSHMNGGSSTNLGSSKNNYSQMAKGFNTQLQKKFFQCEKQRQHYKLKLQALIKKYENVENQIERYMKMERLIDNTIERQNQMRKQVNRLRKDLQLCQIKNIQQQKIYRKEIMKIYQIMEQLRESIQKR